MRYRYATHDSWFMRHSLSIILIAILLVQSVAFHYLRYPQWQEEHIGSYWLHYWSEWMCSVLADTYGALILVLLTKWFYEQGSKEG